MKKKRKYRKKSTKLKSGTIYSIFALGFLALGILGFLSFSRSGQEMTMVNSKIEEYFGALKYLAPFAAIFIGFFFFRFKLFISRAHVMLGFLLIFISLLALNRSGTFGIYLSSFMSDMLGVLGTKLVFLGAFFVGIVVFFDTSLDQIIEAFGKVLQTIPKFFPTKTIGGFGDKNSNDKAKPMTIRQLGMKGQDNEKPAFAKLEQKDPVIVKKDPMLISDKLVSNVLSNGGIWEYPPLNLLSEIPGQKADRGDIKKIASIIEKTLQSFGIDARVAEVNLGPAVTQYSLEIALGTKVSKITSLSNDLALATEAPTGQIRIEAPIPGRNLVGIEIPNRSLEVVTLRTMLSSTEMHKSKSKLSVALGLDVSGTPVVASISKMPHVLIAGTTGSGKSIAINAWITSILFRASPQEVKFIMIDPKRVELTVYNGIPHLLTPVIVEPEKILSALKWAMGEMDRRYKIFAERGVRNIDSYNELSGFQALPYIVIFIDELADLMAFAPVEVEDAIARLAQMARATGIHLAVATQRPSVDVITGLIKANIPCRIAFNVSSMVDSRVILDTPGAEKLLGRGDMLYTPPDQAKPTRIQGTYVSDKEVQKLVGFLKEKVPVVEYPQEVTEQPILIKKGTGSSKDGNDDLLEEAIRIVCQYDRASASLLQRKLSVGYSRAARMLDQLEEAGVVGHAEGSKPRDVLVRNAEEFIAKLHEQ